MTSRVIVRFAQRNGAWVVQARSELDGLAEAEAPFDYPLSPTSRTGLVVARIGSEPCTRDDLLDVGSQLWAGIANGPVRRWLDERLGGSHLTELRLEVPHELAKQPWEALYDERRHAFLASHRTISLVHGTVEPLPATDRKGRSDGRVRCLVVAPQGSGLSVDHELNNLQTAFARYGTRATLDVHRGTVTPDDFAEKLQQERWSIVHFIGHGEVDDSGTVHVRFNGDTLGEERWLAGEVFAGQFVGTGVSLVVLNCCLGASPSARRSMSGIGPALLRAGVPAVVAMRYEIADEDAIRFSSSLYTRLVQGDERGRIDLAVQWARQSLERNVHTDNARSFITPVFFLRPGAEKAFDLPPLPGERSRSSAPGVRERKPDLPQELLEALRDRRCVPFVGDLRAPQTIVRRGAPPRALGTLVRELARACEYPESIPADLDAFGEHRLLTRVAQHFEAQKQRYRLLMEVQKSLQTAEPSESHIALARWRAPGFLCFALDGALETACHREGIPVRVLPSLDSRGSRSDESPLLVHVRGSVLKAQSLLLTELDEDSARDRLDELDSAVVELTKGHIGRCVLVLGVDPRDPLLRALAARLIQSEGSVTQGQTYFVWPEERRVDQAYWSRYRARFIEADPAELVLRIDEWLRGK